MPFTEANDAHGSCPVEYIDATKPISAFCDFAGFLRRNQRVNCIRCKSAYCRFAQNYAILVSEFVRKPQSPRGVRALVLTRLVPLDF